jgi:hypothetical protein
LAERSKNNIGKVKKVKVGSVVKDLILKLKHDKLFSNVKKDISRIFFRSSKKISPKLGKFRTNEKETELPFDRTSMEEYPPPQPTHESTRKISLG